MNANILKWHKRLLRNSLPLIGGWLRRKTARVLARDGSPEAIGALTEAVAGQDLEVHSIALDAIRQVSDQSGINAVCSVWASTRETEISELIAERKWVADAPAYVKVLSALRADVLTALSDIETEAVFPLANACRDKDEHIARQARKAVATIADPKTRQALADELCRRWAETGLPVFRIEIDEAEGPLGIAANGSQHFVIVLSDFLRRRIVIPIQAHENTEARDAQAIRKFEQFAEARFGSVSGQAGQVAMEIPDFQ